MTAIRPFTSNVADRIRASEGEFGFLQSFVHSSRRTVHDRIAETIVVRDPRAAPKR